MFLLQPRIAPFVDYQQPAWLTEKVALRSLQNAKNKLEISSHEEEFRDRLEKRLKLIKNIALEPDSEDEDPQDHHSDQEFEDEVDDGEWDYQEAWDHTWSSSDEEEQEKEQKTCRNVEKPSLTYMPYRCNICPFHSNEISILEVHMGCHVKGNEQSWEHTKITSQNKISTGCMMSQPNYHPGGPGIRCTSQD